uniref:Eumenitin-F n=1 Tax=Eumenes fraterculus TaxID=1035771 RepID=EUMEF_EUMFR|nr:RecName: Full=Eumenitin-F [Eumenes fraterculus]
LNLKGLFKKVASLLT